MERNSLCLAAGVALCGVLCSTPAAAQLTPSGASFLVSSMNVRGTMSAYDSRNNVFLVVGAHGSVIGRLVKADGAFASNPFQIDAATSFPQYPAVAYSPHADSGRGAFLVTWHQSVGPLGNLVHARLISATGTPLTAVFTLGTEGTWWESAPNVTYASTSQVFMVTWRIGAYQIRAARVSITGQNLEAASNPLSPGILVTTGGGERDPSVAYNPETDSFLVAYADFLNGSDVSARLVSAATGAVGPEQRLGGGTSAYITDATFSSTARKFLVGWYQLPGGATGRVVNADGTPSGNPIPLSTRFGTYDSFGLAHNKISQSSLAVGHDLFSAENGGVEISDAGVPGSSAVLTNAGGPTGNFYPRVSASLGEAKWMLTTAHNFASVVAQFVTAVSAAPPAPPTITAHPTTIVARLRQTVTLTAAATGATGVQWQVKSRTAGGFSDVPGATSPSFPVFVTSNDAGKLVRAKFTNGGGAALSTAAVLTVKPTLNDMDGDGRTDPLVWRPSTGTWFAAGTASTANALASGIAFGGLGDQSLTGDMDGDGVADIVIFRPQTGQWFWLKSSTGYDQGQFGTVTWGGFGDVAILADVDGDGKADPTVWRPSTGDWFWLTSSSNYTAAETRRWGGAGDVPLLADFDGDGLADITVWRPSTGDWFWLRSSNNWFAGDTRRWGGQGDQPLLGDFDGDGRADITVFRPSTGQWFWVTSVSGYRSGFVTTWGGQGDVPLLADFDGDGRADITVWRPSTGKWFSLTSASGWTSGMELTWGGSGDVPIVR